MLPNVTLIVAYTSNGRVIGQDQEIPWSFKKDFQHFQACTLGQPIVMGSKTWDSLPNAPLKRRMNIVLSRERAAEKFRGAFAVFNNFDLMMMNLAGFERLFVIGGEEIYKAALPYVNDVIATEVELEVSGNRYFPALPESGWITNASYSRQDIDRKTGKLVTLRHVHYVDTDRATEHYSKHNAEFRCYLETLRAADAATTAFESTVKHASQP